MNERREFTRIDRPVEVDIVFDRTIESTTENVSMKGLRVTSDATLDAGTVVRCTLYIDGRGGTVQVKATGQVVRSTVDEMAIEFQSLEGLESLEHLQRLVMLNAHDKLSSVEREIAEHLGLKRR